jgi:hypothetical protein
MCKGNNTLLKGGSNRKSKTQNQKGDGVVNL